MCIAGSRWPTLALSVLLLSLAGRGFCAAEADTRKGWQFVENGNTLNIVHARGTAWVSDRPDGQTYIYDELDRTDEYVEVRNRTTKLLLRLHADRGYWRRGTDEEWKRWLSGRWLGQEELSGLGKVFPSEYRVRLTYFVPADRQPVANYEQKIRVVMAFVSALYRGDLQAKGYQSNGFSLETHNGEPTVHLIRGDKTASYYNASPDYDTYEQWKRIVPELRNSLGDTRWQLMVVFAETYDEGPAEHLWPGAIARGAYYSADGGLAMYSAHLLKDELCAPTVEDQRRLFFDRTPITGRRAFGHRMDTPRCEFVEDGIGAVAHELGHALGLVHDLRRDDLFVMANGFRNLRWNFAAAEASARRVGFSPENARLLMSSRYVAKDLDLTDNEPPQLELKFVPSRRSLKLSVQASDESGLRAFVLMDRHQGSIIAGRELKGKDVSFEIPVPVNLMQRGGCDLEAFVTDGGGNRTRATEQFGTAAPGSDATRAGFPSDGRRP